MAESARSPQRGRVLVWGACGFVGRHLVSELCARGRRVSVLTRERTRYPATAWETEVDWYELAGEAVSDARVIAAAVADVDVVYDLAGSTGAVQSNRDPLDSLQRNNVALLQVLEAIRLEGRRPRVVLASSRLVYGKPVTLPVDEDHPLAPESIYAAHKLCCEHYLRVYAAQGLLSYTIARISNAYGPDAQWTTRPHGMVNAFVRQAVAGTPIRLFGDGSQLRDLIYVADLVDVVIACGEMPAAADVTLNVGTGVGVSLREMAERIVAMAGGPAVEFVPWPADFAMVETGDYVTNPTRLHRILGVLPRWTIQQGLEATLASCRADVADGAAAAAAAPDIDHSPA